MQTPTGVTINAGQLYSTSSMFWRINSWLSRQILVNRLRSRAAIFGLIVVAAVVGSYAVTAKFVKVYSATAYVRVPAQEQTFWPDGSGVAETTAESNARILMSRNLLSEAAQGLQPSAASSTALDMTLSSDGSKVLVSVTSPNASLSTLIANRAGDIAVKDDQEAWLKEVLARKPTADSSLLSTASVPEVVQEASADSVFPQTLLRTTGGHLIAQAAIVALCAVLALATLLVPESKTDALRFVFSRGNQKQDGIELSPLDFDFAGALPELAVYRLPNHDALPGQQSAATLEFGAAMRSWLTGHTQTHQLHAREFVIARSSGDGYHSRAATLDLARQAASMYLDVVIIDADMCGSYAERDGFGFPDVYGLGDILQAGIALYDCVLEDDEIHGLSGLSAGRFPYHSHEEVNHALDTTRVLDILDVLGSQADVIFIHAPAIQSGSGAQTLGLRADGVILASDHTTGSIDDQVVAARIVQQSGGNLIGVLTIATAETSAEAVPVEA